MKRVQRQFSNTFLTLTVLVAAAVPARAQAPFQILHTFTGSSSDGQYPVGSLTIAGTELYGATVAGGSAGKGTVFKLGTDGGGFNLVHSFTGGGTEGAGPYEGSLVLSGQTLYGTTSNIGATNLGTVYRVNTDGSGFGVLHTFNGGVNDGADIYTSILLSGSNLYGTSQLGGPGDNGLGYGTIYKIGADGTGFGLVHSFTSIPNDGAFPVGTLIQSGSTFYGMSNGGGTSDHGTIYELNTDGTGFSLLHSFASNGTQPLGSDPTGSLIQSGSTLYGMTPYGGTGNGTLGNGVIFKMNTDGTGYSVLHTFVGGSSDGATPWGALIQIGTQLFGTTQHGGAADDGTLFQMNLDGSHFKLIHAFNGADGEFPLGELVESEGILYGMTSGDGSASHGGTIFSIGVPEPSTLALASAGLASLIGYACFRRGRPRPILDRN